MQTAPMLSVTSVDAATRVRSRSASEYNLRVGVLLAAYTLLVAPFVDEVYVAGVEDSSAGHACYLSARITSHLHRTFGGIAPLVADLTSRRQVVVQPNYLPALYTLTSLLRFTQLTDLH